jgi:polyene glycosyltransferase
VYSNRRPILFVSLPESGLVNPLLVLAGELARRGLEDLWFATDENRRGDVVRLADRSALSFASLGDVIPELSAVRWSDEVYREVTQESRFKAFRAAIKQSHKPLLQTERRIKLGAIVRQVRPALMVIDCMCGYGIDVAIALNIPYVLSVPFVPSNVLTAHVPFGRSFTPKGFPVPSSGLPVKMSLRQRIANGMFKIRSVLMVADPYLKKVYEDDARLRAAFGLPRSDEMTRIDKAELVLCYSIPQLDYPFAVPDKVKLVGAMVPPLPEAPAGGPLAAWLDAQPSVVYMGFGTITRLTREEVWALVEVAQRLAGRHQILWKLPEQQRHLLPPGPLPRNLRIEDWVPSQVDVLAHPNVRAFFTHGGGNAYHESVYFGKPQVIRPLWVDCFDQAVRARDFGIGLTLDRPRTIDPDDVVDKLIRVLEEPSFAQEAQRLGAIMRAAGGRRAAADLLLDLPAVNWGLRGSTAAIEQIVP